jgi:hypothetical protein
MLPVLAKVEVSGACPRLPIALHEKVESLAAGVGMAPNFSRAAWKFG